MIEETTSCFCGDTVMRIETPPVEQIQATCGGVVLTLMRDFRAMSYKYNHEHTPFATTRSHEPPPATTEGSAPGRVTNQCATTR